ncbi:MAG: type sorting protein [Ferruginibacter sp.]|uniref:T9SS type A sorting domain-containing protein n=1 Tax=Ferruginibacter sp. TaxID=1940288 RepID=UPI00265A2EDD|nr:T9SS type A sorting domain-containing protein [Ferruginibacter sp.]MDB5277205.1 type sorting protein [Ferruginibacter sp.]
MKTATLPGKFSIFVTCLLMSALFTFAGTHDINTAGNRSTARNKCFSPLGTTESLAANLYLLQPDNSLILADGFYAQYNDAYHDSVTKEDALKLTNPSENVGLTRYGKTLVLERRPIIKANDTLFIKLWKTTQRSYHLELITNFITNIGLQAYLLDAYLNTSTALGLATTIKVNFAVNADAASAATNRFKIVFKPAAAPSPLPVTFTDVKALRQAASVLLKWNVENEINISKYEVERSLNGKDFSVVNTTLAAGKNSLTGSYSWADQTPSGNTSFYRIKSIGTDGSDVQYTSVMKVNMLQNDMSFTVYPNPVTANKINLQLANQPAGVYQVKLIDITGQVLYTSRISVNTNSLSQIIDLERKFPKGIYHLGITSPDNNIQVKRIVVQ